MQPYKLDYTGEEVNSAIGDVLNGQVSGGTQSNYTQNDETQPDYIQNRPGGYYETVPGYSITWDGVIGDKPKVALQEGAYLVKVSDEVLTAEQVIGAKVSSVYNGESEAYTVVSDDVYEAEDYCIAAQYGNIVVVSASVQTIMVDGTSIDLPEIGTYFVSESGDNTFYTSSLQNNEHQALVPIPGELTNIKGGYDLPAISNQPVYSGTVPASAFSVATQSAQGGEIAVQAVIVTAYSAPIALTNPLAEDATVSGTVNGTAVSGVVTEDGAGVLGCALYTTGASGKVAVQEGTSDSLVCTLTSNAVMVRANPPEADMVLALSQSREATPKVIPAEYLDVDLSTVQDQIDSVSTTANNALNQANAAQTTANAVQTTANAAQTTANAAQTTANAAQTTANAAQTTANNIKPDWNISDSTSPKYIANRPFYINATEIKSYGGIPTASTLYTDTSIYWSGAWQSSGGNVHAPAISSGGMYKIQGENTVYKAVTARRAATPVYYYIIGNASLVADVLDIIPETGGGTFEDTGEDWAYVTYRTSVSSSMFSTEKNKFFGRHILTIQTELKQLDEEYIPDTIQRVGADVIINSSTSGSTKKFKITVDDSGTLTATEVTE